MQKVFFLDIDDCLIETSRLGSAELQALYRSLKEYSVQKTKSITSEFEASFHRLYDAHQGKKLKAADKKKLKAYLSRLKQLEIDIIKRHHQIKIWSREVCLYIAAEKFNIRLSQNQITNVSGILWREIARHTPLYPDAKKFLLKLLKKHTPFYLITSSDCRLKYDFRKDKFIYDPDYSRNLKLQRLKKLTSLGIISENIFIGDPFDKPLPRVFKNALQKAQKDLKIPFSSIMIGDSVNNDLLPAKKAGFKNLIWLKRHKNVPTKKIPSEIMIIKSFSDL